MYGNEHEKTAGALYALAAVAASKDLDAARELLTQALEIRQRVLPANDPDIAINLGALASTTKRATSWNGRASCISRHSRSSVTPASAIIPGLSP